MRNVCCKLNNDASTLKAQISIQMEIVLPSLLLTSIVGILQKELNGVALEILKQLFRQIDLNWLLTRGKGIDVCKFVPRTLKCVFGKLKFKYRQAKKNGKHFRPLLETLGIGKGQILTRDLIEVGLCSTLYASYRKALKIAGNVCSLGALWSAVQKEAEIYVDKRDQAIYYYTEGCPQVSASTRDFAIVMIDEIWIRQRSKGDFIRVKVARLGVIRHKDGTYECEPLRVFATAKGDQKSFAKKAKKFFDATSGLHEIPRIAVVTDGCDMGKEFCKIYGDKAVWQLDWWHLWGYVHKGCKFDKDLERRVWDLLNVEKIDEALGILSAYRVAMQSMEEKLKDYGKKMQEEGQTIVKPEVFWSSRQLEHIQKLITYITNNREGIYGVKKFVKEIPAEYLPFASGPIERLQAVMIAYRMKKQGKHWSIEGADNLIQLLSREWNGEELEKILEEGTEGLEEWESLCIKELVIEDLDKQAQSRSRRKKRMNFSPNPIQCIPLLKRGRYESCFTLLKHISDLKQIPHVVEFRKEESPAA